jgi:serine protease AprX
VWAVVDSGIDARHPAFRLHSRGQPGGKRGPIAKKHLAQESRIIATYDFRFFRQLVSANLDQKMIEKDKDLEWLAKRMAEGEALAEIVQDLRNALESGRELDWEAMGRVLQVPHTEDYRVPKVEHGTHVAGILAADWPGRDRPAGAAGGDAGAGEPHEEEEFDESALPDEVCCGICPDIKLFDLRVLDDEGKGDEFNVMAALQFVRYLNQHRDIPVINGVNLSLSIRHDVANFACGRTPICEECERLVGDGIVVVAAAGNEGYMQFMTGQNGLQHMYHSISITDPGNAEGVITVGATHRYEPHTYGVSYFSSRGPTGDGRAKPDLVAPGEKITAPALENEYRELDGTSMAAPHVSGAAALLMARHRELLGQPVRVKRILCGTATDLGRERYFQGAGMVDVLRALQSI